MFPLMALRTNHFCFCSHLFSFSWRQTHPVTHRDVHHTRKLFIMKVGPLHSPLLCFLFPPCVSHIVHQKSFLNNSLLLSSHPRGFISQTSHSQSRLTFLSLINKNCKKSRTKRAVPIVQFQVVLSLICSTCASFGLSRCVSRSTLW